MSDVYTRLPGPEGRSWLRGDRAGFRLFAEEGPCSPVFACSDDAKGLPRAAEDLARDIGEVSGRACAFLAEPGASLRGSHLPCGPVLLIVGTEAGILHQMHKLRPGAELLPIPADSGCNCALCPYMKLNSVEKLYLALRDLQPEILLDEDVRRRALGPVERMLALG